MARILVVDDDTSTTSALTALLQGDGYDVEAFRSAQEAASKLPGQVFDVVITDLDIKGAAGADFIKAVTTHLPKVPLFLMTNHPQGAPGKGLRGKVTRVFEKPIRYPELLEEVQKALRQSLMRESR